MTDAEIIERHQDYVMTHGRWHPQSAEPAYRQRLLGAVEREQSKGSWGTILRMLSTIDPNRGGLEIEL